MGNLEQSFVILWYVVIIVSIMHYAMLDGFDLGVGILLLCQKQDRERRVCINAIGPVWDGNEVWLVIVLGALFAGFPLVYSTLLSAFNTPVMFLIFALIFRAVAIEFRSKRPSALWRGMWDWLFFTASLIIAFAVGVSLGNFVQGIPLDQEFQYQGGIILTFLRPYPVLVGVLTIALFMLHGAIFLVMKTEEALQQKLMRLVNPCLVFFLIAYVFTTVVTLIYQPHMIARFREDPLFFLLPALDMLVIANIPRMIHKKRYGWAFLCSCANMALLLALFAVGLFPELIRSSIDPRYSLTIFNSASSLETLVILAIIVAIGVPLVIVYMSWIYRVFRGKVILDDHSY